MWTLAPNVNTIGANTTPPRDATTADVDIAARLLTSPSGLHPQIKAPDTSELSTYENWIASTGHNLRRKQKGGRTSNYVCVYFMYCSVNV